MDLGNKINLILTIISIVIFVLFSIVITNYFNISFSEDKSKKELIRKAVFENYLNINL